MVKYTGRARQRVGSVNTNQLGLKMSGGNTAVGRAGIRTRRVFRRVQSNIQACGDITYHGVVYKYNPWNAWCLAKQPLTRAQAGGVNRLNVPRLACGSCAGQEAEAIVWKTRCRDCHARCPASGQKSTECHNAFDQNRVCGQQPLWIPPVDTVYTLSYPSQKQDDPLGIGKRTHDAAVGESLGYCLFLGDWGAGANNNDVAVEWQTPGAPAIQFCLQKAVAEKMKDLVAKRTDPLLFILTQGDNFYMMGMGGANDPNFPAGDHPDLAAGAVGMSAGQGLKAQWYDVYSDPDPKRDLTRVPWLLSLGNHDWGTASGSNSYSVCPWRDPKATWVKGFAHSLPQLNASKGGYRPKNVPNVDNFYLPDLSYHYTIPELDLELLILDTNIVGCPEEDAGWPSPYDEPVASAQCGQTQTELCRWLELVGKASLQLLDERARVSTRSNVIITQHYAGDPIYRERGYPDLVPLFEPDTIVQQYNKMANKERMKNTDLRMVYGHIHATFCDDERWRPITPNNATPKDQCKYIINGGGGGCCAPAACITSQYPQPGCADMTNSNFPVDAGAGPIGFSGMEFIRREDGGVRMNNLPIPMYPQSRAGAPELYPFIPLDLKGYEATLGYPCSMSYKDGSTTRKCADVTCQQKGWPDVPRAGAHEHDVHGHGHVGIPPHTWPWSPPHN